MHQELLRLASVHRNCLSETLEMLSELNRRKGFLELGHESLLKYCVKELRLSESAAYRRIKALKILSKSADTKALLNKGDLTLTQISKASELFDQFKHDSGRPLPAREQSALLRSVVHKESHQSENQIREALELPQKPRKISIDVSEETYELWKKFKSLNAHKDLSDEMLLRFAIEKAESVEAPKKKMPIKEHKEDSRYIPAHLKREVFKKAGYKCQWKECKSVYALEIDHIMPIAKGGKTIASNLRLLCRNHNQARNYQ